MKRIKLLLFAAAMLFSPYFIFAQGIVEHVGIALGSIDVTSSTVVGQVTIDPTVDGKVFVRFDGSCIADAGDRIVLAASNTTSWGANDGNVGVEVIDGDVNNKSFAHTRVYDVTAGSHTFYAIAHNYVETDGNGLVAIYGSLTVEFVPNGGNQTLDVAPIAQTSVNLSTETTLDQITINPTVDGKAIVRFDGTCTADVGDRIILAASNTPSWSPNDGAVSVEAYDADVNHAPFSHTRVYDITAGSHTFYAVAQNYVETDGSGIAHIFGTLTVEFIPTGAEVTADHAGISTTVSDLSAVTELAQITINPAVDGKAIVQFNGACGNDVGDRIILAASDNVGWTPDDGNVGVEVPNLDQNYNSFSHTRVYDVVAGSRTFYAVAQNYVETAGNGSASIYASLTVQFVPNATNSVGEISVINDVLLYPNPASGDQVTIESDAPVTAIQVYDLKGNEVPASFDQNNILLQGVQPGQYLVKVVTSSGAVVKELMVQ